MTLYAWPAQTAFGRVIPKSRIYEGSGASRALQKKFVDQVERIEWTHVLRPDTLNLKAADKVEELAVIAITLHQLDVDSAVLAAIERAIPRPLIIELRHAARARLAIAWKRPSLAASGQWVTSQHFFTAWGPADTPRTALPQALNLAALYGALIDPLLPPRKTADEKASARVDRAEEAGQLEREITRLEKLVARERQFNRKVELNRTLNAARKEHAQLLKA